MTHTNVDAITTLGTLKRGAHLERGTSWKIHNMPMFGDVRVGSGVLRIKLDDGRVTAWFDTSLRSSLDAMLLEARVDLGVRVSLTEYRQLMTRRAAAAKRARKAKR